MSARERQSLLQTQMSSKRTNIQSLVCSNSSWALAEGKQSKLELCEERLGFVALAKELKGQQPGSL